MMKAYFENTNGGTNVILTDGITAKIFNGAPSGFYEGVDLCMTDEDGRTDVDGIAAALEARFAALEAAGELNSYDEIYSANEVEYSNELAAELEEAALFYDSEWRKAALKF